MGDLVGGGHQLCLLDYHDDDNNQPEEFFYSIYFTYYFCRACLGISLLIDVSQNRRERK